MKYSFLSLAFAAFVLAGCTGPVIMGGDAAVMAATKQWSKPPADTASQIPPHESWCYSTMGDTECFAQAQDTQPNRLVNVDPQNRYPLNAPAYRQVVANDKRAAEEKVAAAGAPPTALTPAPTIAVEQKDELVVTPDPQSDAGGTAKSPQ
ncbi:MAG: hypothetical protein WCD70_12120 [Alphaproteobacteria bacterium]